MQLRPIDTEQPSFALRDEEATAHHAPSGGKLRRKLAKRLKTLEEQQIRLHADGRYSLLIVLQGRDSAGKDGTIRRVFGATCPPTQLSVINYKAPNEVERQHDFLWRIHKAIPAYGTVGIFNRSHYEDVVTARVHDLVPKSQWKRRFDQINDFERMLAENNVIVLKFLLHISREEQRRRMLKRLYTRSHNWKFQIGDLDDRALWDSYTTAYHDVLRRCSTVHAPWYLVPADDKRVRDYLIAGVVGRTLKKAGLDYPEVDATELAHAEQALRAVPVPPIL